MNCYDFLPLISGHIDQMNNVQEEQALQAHLASCPACREILAQMTKNDSLLNASAATPPDDLTQRIMTEVRKTQSKSKVSKTAIISAVVSGLSVAAVMALVFLGRPMLGGFKSEELYAEAAENEAAYDAAVFYDEPEEYEPAAEVGTEAAAIGETAAPAEEGLLDSDSSFGSFPETAGTYIGGSYTGPAKRGTHTDTVSGLSHPVLIIWNVDAAEFPSLADFEPIQLDEVASNEILQLPDDIIARLSPDSAQGDAFTKLIAYQLPYGIMTQLITECSEKYETNVYYPPELLSEGNCIILLVPHVSEN